MKVGISIRTQIHAVLALAATFCIITVISSSISTQEIINGIRTSYTLNATLSNFYTTVQKMDVEARDWVYLQSEEKYKEYEGFLEEARQQLQAISDHSQNHLRWRMGLLDNMLDYYQAPIEQFRQGDLGAYDTYNVLQYRCKLIRDTATDYYGYLSDYLEQNASQVQRQWQLKWIVQAGSLGLLVVMGIVLNGIYSRSILHPIQILMANTRKVQNGDYRLEPIGNSCSELAVMAKTMEEMAQQVQRNMDVLKKNAELEQALHQEESQRLVMQNLVTQAELRSLQSQINPHFLFNTLSMISKSAYLNHDTTTNELIDCLAEFLRYALEKSSTTATLEEEIHSIHDYLFIQKKRFGQRLDFEIDVPREIPRLKMPAIILQPLVENAIKHGVDSMTNAAVVSLKVRKRDNTIRIQVEDNGVGMSAETLEKLQASLSLGLETSQGGQGTGIGLTNVYRRLKMYFGKEMHFNIESDEGCGTLVTIDLPDEEEV